MEEENLDNYPEDEQDTDEAADNEDATWLTEPDVDDIDAPDLPYEEEEV